MVHTLIAGNLRARRSAHRTGEVEKFDAVEGQEADAPALSTRE
ncbi:hypothetical protein ACFXO9_27775 [Nocardia tengchongensis]